MLQESGEMYLETIYILSLKNPNVRSVDVSEYMGYSRPSVSRAVGLLRDKGYLTMEDDGLLKLTPDGLELAKKIYHRHVLLRQFLMSLGVAEDIADEDACKIEHIISEESFAAIERQVEQKK